jgi:hypothetical protein
MSALDCGFSAIDPSSFVSVLLAISALINASCLGVAVLNFSLVTGQQMIFSRFGSIV